MTGTEHHCTIIDRGTRHVHRWRALCVCGWVSRNKRRKPQAAKEYRQHEEGKTHTRRRDRRMTPRPPTPAADLPDALRTPS